MEVLKANKPLLFVHPGHELYGADKMLLLNIKAAREKYSDREIVVILPMEGELSEILKSYENVQILIKKTGTIRKYDLKRFDFSAFLKIFSFFRLIKFLNSFELVYINTLVVIDYMLAVRFCKAEAYIHIHEIPNSLACKVFSKILDFSQATLIFVSEASRNSMHKLKNKKQIILWNGVKAITKNVSETKNDLKVKLLLIGRINTWKGQTLLIEAISLLKENERNGINVKILGDVYLNQQYLKNNLLEMIKASNLKNIIEILPFTSSPDKYYNWADIVIVPSLLPEPFGLVAIEAMSLGKLVIAADHGGLSEIIENNVSGILFEPCNANDLASKLSEIMCNQHLITEIGIKGQNIFNTRFTEEIFIQKLKQII
jgi:glycosyltransferase involved in cell wall biosynthesis